MFFNRGVEGSFTVHVQRYACPGFGTTRPCCRSTFALVEIRKLCTDGAQQRNAAVWRLYRYGRHIDVGIVLIAQDARGYVSDTGGVGILPALPSFRRGVGRYHEEPFVRILQLDSILGIGARAVELVVISVYCDCLLVFEPQTLEHLLNDVGAVHYQVVPEQPAHTVFVVLMHQVSMVEGEVVDAGLP